MVPAGNGHSHPDSSFHRRSTNPRLQTARGPLKAVGKFAPDRLRRHQDHAFHLFLRPCLEDRAVAYAGPMRRRFFRAVVNCE